MNPFEKTSEHGIPPAVVVVAALVLLGLAFLAGRSSKPGRVEERIKVETVEKQVVVTQERVRVERVLVRERAKAIHRETNETRAPDGTVTKTTITDVASSSTEKQEKHAAADRASQRTEEARAVASKRHVQTSQSRLFFDGLVGVDVTRAFAPSYGAAVRIRAVGPLCVGAFALSNGTVGLSVGLAF